MCSLNHTDIRSDEHLSHSMLVAIVLNFSLPSSFVSPARRLSGMCYNDNDMPRNPVSEITLHSRALLSIGEQMETKMRQHPNCALFAKPHLDQRFLFVNQRLNKAIIVTCSEVAPHLLVMKRIRYAMALLTLMYL